MIEHTDYNDFYNQVKYWNSIASSRARNSKRMNKEIDVLRMIEQ